MAYKRVTLTAVSAYVSHSVVSDSATPWTVACQVPLSMGFSKQEYCSGLTFPSPGNLPYPKIKPGSPALEADSQIMQGVLGGTHTWDAQEKVINFRTEKAGVAFHPEFNSNLLSGTT